MGLAHDVRPGHERLTLIFDVAIAALTTALAIWLAQLTVWARWLRERRVASWSALIRQHGLTMAACLGFPLVLLYLVVEVPMFRVLAEFQPDLASWLGLVAVAVFAKLVIEVVVAGRVIGELGSLA